MGDTSKHPANDAEANGSTRDIGKERLWPTELLSGNPHDVADKADRVRTMFDRIAPRYDLTNIVVSFGLSEIARRRFAKNVLASIRASEPVANETSTASPSSFSSSPIRILDVACGTGAISATLARKNASAEIAGVDFSEGMLAVARRKHARHANLRFSAADAMRLPFADASFDAATCVYGLRNMQNPHAALAEFVRVVKPAGRVWIMDFAMPTARIFGGAFRFYFLRVLPTLAGLISGDRSGAYSYLPKSVADWKPPQNLIEWMQAAGLDDVACVAPTFGPIVTISGTKRR